MTVLIHIQAGVEAWQIPDRAVDRLREQFPEHTFIHATDKDTRARGLAEADVAFTWRLKAEELARAPRLRWVHTSAVAVDTLCLPELAARGVIVSNSRGVQAAPIAEHVIMCLLGLARQLPLAFEEQRHARWSPNAFTGPRLPRLVRGWTLGLVGAGTIGLEVARLATALGMEVVALRRRPLPIPGIARVLVGRAGLEELLDAADAVVLATPPTPATHHLIGRPELARLRPGAVLVNVGRGTAVDTDALVDALASGHLAGVALDVFPREPLPPDHLLWTCPNVIITPHSSGFRAGHWDEAVALFADNLRRLERGEPLRHVVDAEAGY
ncbi:MAG: D-2-hydroxyacid dehydrogenase [Acidobacteriota bacterium]